MDINEIKKDLMRTKAEAKLMYYDPANGDLMYEVTVLGKQCVFPIHTVQSRKVMTGGFDEMDGPADAEYLETIKLTDDLKGARFEPVMRGSSLIRWIQQAFEKNEFH